MSDHPDFVAFPDTLIRVRLCDRIDRRFFVALWNSRDTRDQIERKAKTTAGIYKVNQVDVAACVLQVPPLAEQVRIRNMVEKVFHSERAMVAEIAGTKTRTAALHQAVLDGAFGGVLANPNDA